MKFHSEIFTLKRSGIQAKMNTTVTFAKNRGFTTRSSHLRRLKNGEDAAWLEFYRKYQAMIFAIGRKLHLPEEVSEDLMQEVAVVCYRRLQTFIYNRDNCRFRSFLFQVTTNISRNLRRKKRKKLPPEIFPADEILPSLDEDFLREYERLILDRSFLILKESVDSETYLAFEMLFIEDRPVSEVAAITGKTANTLYSIKHRCLKKLQTIIIQLQNQLETPPDTGMPAAPNTTSR